MKHHHRFLFFVSLVAAISQPAFSGDSVSCTQDPLTIPNLSNVTPAACPAVQPQSPADAACSAASKSAVLAFTHFSNAYDAYNARSTAKLGSNSVINALDAAIFAADAAKTADDNAAQLAIQADKEPNIAKQKSTSDLAKESAQAAADANQASQYAETVVTDALAAAAVNNAAVDPKQPAIAAGDANAALNKDKQAATAAESATQSAIVVTNDTADAPTRSKANYAAACASAAAASAAADAENIGAALEMQGGKPSATAKTPAKNTSAKASATATATATATVAGSTATATAKATATGGSGGTPAATATSGVKKSATPRPVSSASDPIESALLSSAAARNLYNNAQGTQDLPAAKPGSSPPVVANPVSAYSSPTLADINCTLVTLKTLDADSQDQASGRKKINTCPTGATMADTACNTAAANFNVATGKYESIREKFKTAKKADPSAQCALSAAAAAVDAAEAAEQAAIKLAVSADNPATFTSAENLAEITESTQNEANATQSALTVIDNAATALDAANDAATLASTDPQHSASGYAAAADAAAGAVSAAGSVMKYAPESSTRSHAKDAAACAVKAAQYAAASISQIRQTLSTEQPPDATQAALDDIRKSRDMAEGSADDALTAYSTTVSSEQAQGLALNDHLIDPSSCNGYQENTIFGSANVLDMGLRTCNSDANKLSISVSSTQQTSNGSIIWASGEPDPTNDVKLHEKEYFFGINGNVAVPAKSGSLETEYYSGYAGYNWGSFSRSSCTGWACLLGGSFRSRDNDPNAFIYAPQFRVRGGAYDNNGELTKGNFLEESNTFAVFAPTSTSGVNPYAYLTITPLYVDERTDNLNTPANPEYKTLVDLMGNGRGIRDRRSVNTGFSWYPCAPHWGVISKVCVGTNGSAAWLAQFYLSGAFSAYKYYGGAGRPSFAELATESRDMSVNYKLPSIGKVGMSLTYDRQFGKDISVGIMTSNPKSSVSVSFSLPGGL